MNTWFKLAAFVAVAFVSVNPASAQSRSGTSLGSPNAEVLGQVVPFFRDPALQRLGLRNSNRVRRSDIPNVRGNRRELNRRSGSGLGTITTRRGASGTRSSIFGGPVISPSDISRGELLFVERDRRRRARDVEVLRDNQLRRLRAQQRDLADIGQSSLANDFPIAGEVPIDDFGTGQLVAPRTPACPSGYNCGYRIYSNGTGPRIITPGVGPADGLPQFDGVNGPAIIRIQ